MDDTAIPTGELEPVKGGPFDFVKPKKIGARIQELPGRMYNPCRGSPLWESPPPSGLQC